MPEFTESKGMGSLRTGVENYSRFLTIKQSMYVPAADTMYELRLLNQQMVHPIRATTAPEEETGFSK